MAQSKKERILSRLAKVKRSIDQMEKIIEDTEDSDWRVVLPPWLNQRSNDMLEIADIAETAQKEADNDE